MIDDPVLLAEWVNAYRRRGIRIAIDDFGAGYAGLNLLADLQPDLMKLDIGLVRGIEGRGARQSIVRAIVQVSVDLGIDVVAEGVETEGELAWLADQGIDLFQGFLCARPGFECLPHVTFPVARVASVCGALGTPGCARTIASAFLLREVTAAADDAYARWCDRWGWSSACRATAGIQRPYERGRTAYRKRA